MIYLDNAATTKVSPQIQEYINGIARDFYGNPSSHHFSGHMAHKVLDYSRHNIADYIGCEDNEIIFTASGSEANNMALKGFYFDNLDSPVTIITTAIEHKSILNTCGFLERIGCNIKYLDVNMFGMVKSEQLEKLCKECYDNNEPFLVSIQFANNEIGAVQPIKHLSDIVHKYGGIFHTDAVQAFSEYHINVKEYGIDMMSVSGHKFGCPKGIGLLYKSSKVDIEPLIHGGGQEFGLRAGTENLPYIAGISKAIDLLTTRTKEYNKELEGKRDYLKYKLLNIKGSQMNGSASYRLCNNINISFKGIQSDALLALLDGKGICVSSGSACNSGDSEPSYVLKAIGVDKEYIDGTIRITIDNDISYAELDIVATEIADAVNALRMFE